MNKRWLYEEELNKKEQIIKNRIIKEIKCPEMIAEMLIRKNLIDKEKIFQYFNPSLDSTHSPFKLNDMNKAADRIVAAVNKEEKISIYGDYDVDGTTSTALLYLGLKKIAANIDYYIPHRMIDGYGLSVAGVEELAEKGTNLIITVDCGINAFKEVERVTKLGVDVIITDHHNPQDTLPETIAVINPKRKDSKYDYKDLAGVGVAYKLLMAVYNRLQLDSENFILKYIDLVALGTIADIVPLTGENRIFTSLGLRWLRKKRNIGLSALISKSGLGEKDLNSGDIVFGIAPRINAAGRMGSADRAVDLLISEDREECEQLADIIERENSIRQQIDKETFEEACEIIEKKYKNLDETYCIVVSSSNWHPGVIGIVASKLVEKYYKPAIMITFQDGIGSGSGRSIYGIDLFDAISNVTDYLENFGGHKYAAGLSILVEYVDAFENQLQKYIKKHYKDEIFIPPLKLESSLELYDINDNLLDWLEKFAPFGPGNMRPIFYTKDVMIVGYPYNVGSNHLKLKVIKDGCSLNLIGFNFGDYLSLLNKGDKIDIAYSLEFNTWKDRTTIQGKLRDLKLHRT